MTWYRTPLKHKLKRKMKATIVIGIAIVAVAVVVLGLVYMGETDFARYIFDRSLDAAVE